MTDKFKIDTKQCLTVDFVFRERLQDSLSYIFDNAISNQTEKQLLKKLLNCGVQHKAWKFSALNSYLIEEFSKGTVTPNWNNIKLELDSDFNKQQKILTIDDLSDFEKNMIFKYVIIEENSRIVDDDEKKAATENVTQAIAVMQECAPEYYEEMEILMDGVLLCKTDIFESGSSFDLAKLIYIKAEFDLSMAAIFRTIKRIVHENAHTFLHLLSIDDEMVQNPMSELFSSPFRKDPRPMMGIFHAHFVLFRLIGLMEQDGFASLLQKNGILFNDELQSLKNKLVQTANTISQHAKLTPLGQAIFTNSNSVI